MVESDRHTAVRSGKEETRSQGSRNFPRVSGPLTPSVTGGGRKEVHEIFLPPVGVLPPGLTPGLTLEGFPEGSWSLSPTPYDTGPVLEGPRRPFHRPSPRRHLSSAPRVHLHSPLSRGSFCSGPRLRTPDVTTTPTPPGRPYRTSPPPESPSGTIVRGTDTPVRSLRPGHTSDVSWCSPETRAHKGDSVSCSTGPVVPNPDFPPASMVLRT